MDHWWLVIGFPLNFTHKVACAAILGVYGLQSHSWEQVGLLIGAQVSVCVCVCLLGVRMLYVLPLHFLIPWRDLCQLQAF